MVTHFHKNFLFTIIKLPLGGSKIHVVFYLQHYHFLNFFLDLPKSKMELENLQNKFCLIEKVIKSNDVGNINFEEINIIKDVVKSVSKPSFSSTESDENKGEVK